MKKIILVLMVICVAIPALAADVKIRATKTAPGELTISYIAQAGAGVRGIALKVTVTGGGEVTAPAAATATAGVFNVFMDRISDDPETYGIGSGNAVADPAAAGTLTLPAAAVSLCAGFVDTGGSQAPALDAGGIVEVLTISVATSCITVELDTLRGGVVGDDIGTVILPDPMCMDDLPCLGDANKDDAIYTDDLTELIDYLGIFSAEYFYCAGTDYRFESNMDINADGAVYTDDLTELTDILTALSGSYFFQACP
ncbi:MAG: hypothetical protein FVQ79_04015 [Planctomycetes bacterium]|nr:hypothetical protein [Planctomycetota bacterium]